jgi:hypothetical protein
MPNYALLGNVKDMMLPEKENPIVAGLNQYMKMQSENKKLDAELGIAKAQQELYGAQGETMRKKLEFLPQEMELERLKAQASIGATNASAEASRTSAAAARQAMSFATQEQQMKKTEAAFNLLGGVLSADPTKQPQAYNTALNMAKQMGYGPQLKNLSGNFDQDKPQLEYLYAATGQQLKQAQMQQEMAKIPLEAVIDPVTNKAVYVRRDQAAGLQPADPKLGGGTGTTNPIAAELPKAQAKQLVQLQNESAAAAEQANQLRNQVSAFKNVTKEMALETGAKYKIPGSTAFSSAAQNAQQISKQLTLNASSALKGAISDRDMITIEASIPNITNQPNANKAISERLETASKRAEQKPLFIQTMTSNGVYDPGVINAAWTQYINDNPVFDEKTGKPKTENLTNWKKYTSPKYIEKLTQGGGDTGNQAAEQNALPVRRYNPETGMIE